MNCGFFGVNAVPKHQTEDTAEYRILQITEKEKNKELVNHVWRALYRREICLQFNEAVCIGEDQIFNIRILGEHRDLSAWKCSKRLYFHWWRPNSLFSAAGIDRYGHICRDILREMETLPIKKYAVIGAAKEVLGFRYLVESSKGAEQYRARADELLKQVRSLMVKSKDIPFSEKAMYLPFLCSPKLYSLYRSRR